MIYNSINIIKTNTHLSPQLTEHGRRENNDPQLTEHGRRGNNDPQLTEHGRRGNNDL
jgi:hypothetical protein